MINIRDILFPFLVIAEIFVEAFYSVRYRSECLIRFARCRLLKKGKLYELGQDLVFYREENNLTIGHKENLLFLGIKRFSHRTFWEGDLLTFLYKGVVVYRDTANVFDFHEAQEKKDGKSKHA